MSYISCVVPFYCTLTIYRGENGTYTSFDAVTKGFHTMNRNDLGLLHTQRKDKKKQNK